jgi:predicted RNA binding protein YcfA (HicA-like mRNA interferase family)
MSDRLPIVSGRKLCQTLEKAGFRLIAGRGKGSHMFLHREEPPTGITIPDDKEIKRGTLRAILRQAGIGVDEFRQLLDD